MKQTLLILLALTVALNLAACGKRASDVEPDDGMMKDAYPRAYPDVSTDPKGRYIPGQPAAKTP